MQFAPPTYLISYELYWGEGNLADARKFLVSAVHFQKYTAKLLDWFYVPCKRTNASV